MGWDGVGVGRLSRLAKAGDFCRRILSGIQNLVCFDRQVAEPGELPVVVGWM
jgi:hypothetical protein